MEHVTNSASASRIVFIDVDGTILEHGSVIAPSTVSAIRSARAAGHRVYLCTGRAAADIHPDVRAIDVDGAITNDYDEAFAFMERLAAERGLVRRAERPADFLHETDDMQTE